MKQILIMVILLAGLIAPVAVNAQKVYKDASNRVILDLTVVAGMPKNAVTATKKTWIGTPSNNGGPLTNNTENEAINATVFHKLEIAPHDINSAKVIGASGTMTMDWATAFNICKNSSSYGGGWRSPTQRELMLIYIFRPALEMVFVDSAIKGTAFVNEGGYWSATENDAKFSWSVHFGDGGTYNTLNTALYRVRCVREITN